MRCFWLIFLRFLKWFPADFFPRVSSFYFLPKIGRLINFLVVSDDRMRDKNVSDDRMAANFEYWKNYQKYRGNNVIFVLVL